MLATNDLVLAGALYECAPRVFGESAVDDLLNRLRSAQLSDWQRANLLSALACVRQPDAISALAAVVASEPDESMSQQAAASLAQMGSVDAVSALVVAIEARSVTSVDDPIVRALSKAHNKDSFGYFIELFKTTTNPVLRHAAASVLLNAGEDGRSLGLEELDLEDSVR